MMQGVVKRITTKTIPNGSQVFNIQMDDGDWYGFGFDKPAFSEGQQISFEVEFNGRYKNVAKGSAQVIGGAPAPAQQQQPAASGSMGRDDFWANKEKRDIVVQRIIQYQAARNSAIELVKVAVEAEAIALPAKKADKMDALVAIVRELTDVYVDDAREAGSGKKKAEAKPAPQEPTDDFDDDIPF